MALEKSKKAGIITTYATKEGDTGSPEVQVAILTAQINELTEHLKANKNDKHSRYGLTKMVSRRRALLDYLKANSLERYTKLIEQLKIRK